MREYILTQQEKEIIQEYLASGKKLDGFRTLLCRTRNMKRINSDIELIKQFLAKAGAKPA